MKKDKVVAFGEIMMRLSTERHLRFIQAKTFNVSYGGGEFNVAVSLANYGIDSEFVTKVPDNDIGACTVKELRKLKVGLDNVVIGGDRLGLYYLETGAGTRGSKVVYDRAYSAFATADDNDYDWEEILKDSTWFHWSGITPAISESATKQCLKAVKAAHKLGLKISCDLNYRSKLWNYGKQPSEVMPELLKYSHIILGDIDTAYFMLGENKVAPNYENRSSLPSLYGKIFELCPNLEIVATTLRYSVSASHHRIGGILYDGNTIYKAAIREVTPIVDRVGSGDAFMGGLIYGLLSYEDDYQKTLDFSVAACCLKHTISGDYNLSSLEEVEKMMSGDDTGKVSR